jgi:hypothetical protein
MKVVNHRFVGALELKYCYFYSKSAGTEQGPGVAFARLDSFPSLYLPSHAYADLGWDSGEVCRALDWGVDGRRLDELSR